MTKEKENKKMTKEKENKTARKHDRRKEDAKDAKKASPETHFLLIANEIKKLTNTGRFQASCRLDVKF